MEKKPVLTEQQQEVVNNRGGDLLVSAAAGSGKTKVLVDRIMARVCDEGRNINDFLVITYTRAAAAELRAKITAELSKRLAVDPSNEHIRKQMYLAYAAQISTVHAFCSNILRSNAAMIGLPPDFRVGEEQECMVLRSATMEDLLEAAYKTIDRKPDVKAFIEKLAFGRDDAAVPAIIYNVFDTVQSHPWPEQWVAQCLANMDVNRYKDAAETPWGRYIVDNTKNYIRSQLPLVQTAIETCALDPVLSQTYGDTLAADLAKLSSLLVTNSWNSLYMAAEEKWARMKPVKKGESFSEEVQGKVKALRDRYKKAVDGKMKGIYGLSKEVLEDLQKTEASIRGMFELVGEFTDRYNAKKELHNVLDFSDLEHYTIRMLLDEKTHMRTDIAKSIEAQFVEIMVDEYQDTNGVQETIFSAISNGQNRFMVGDVKQSIYMFRLADPSIFLGHYRAFVPYYAAADGEARKIMLTKNFRSRPEILDATNAVMKTCMSPEVGGVEYGEDETLQAGREDFNPVDAPVVELAAINMDGLTASDNEDAEAMAKVDVEAKYVACRVKELLDGSVIQDEETGTMRPVHADDIAILLRSTKSSAPHYIKALADLGIASKSSRNGSIMDTTEVATLYSYLQVIDNPMQDIPLVAILASPLVGFTADGLAAVRMAKRDAKTFYEALQAYAVAGHKLGIDFLNQMNAFRAMAPHVRLSSLFSEILMKTDADDVFGSMSNGEQRMSNIHKFGEMIAGYEAGGSRGLFEFLCYIEALREQGTELPQASTALADEAVSILSIHASKGLEYPIVFLSDLSRRFNTGDLKGSALLHRELGAGIQVVDKELMYRYPTIARAAIATCAAVEAKSEELRILYVAMTRAKQKLVMTYCDKLGRTMSRLADETCDPLPPAIAQSVANPGEWVLMTALNRREADTLYGVAGTIGRPVSASKYPWAITVVNANDIVGKKLTMEELEAESVSSEEDEDTTIAPVTPFSLDIEKVAEEMKFEYPHRDATKIPAKAVATQLYKKTAAITIRRPNFAKEKEGFTAAERGTATHLFMRYANYAKCVLEGRSGIEEEIARMVVNGFISELNSKAIIIPALATLFASKEGKELALMGDRAEREFPFTILVPANELYGEDAPADKVLLQGIVDLYSITDDGIIVYDFKSDYAEDEAEEAAKAAGYKNQLDLYGKALSIIHGKPVTEKNIVFLRTGHKVAV